MSSQQTLPGFGSVTFSPESPDGHLPPGSQDGPTTESCGPVRARASRSASRASNAAPTTNGTYGPTSFDCSVPAGPLSGWESRLRQRLVKIGSTECYLTWKGSTTPGGRLLSRLVPSMGRTVVIESGSSPEMALWVTASARDWKDTPGMVTTRPDGRSRIDQLPRQVAAAMYPTQQAMDGNKGNMPPRDHDTGVSLPQRVAQMAQWPTPNCSNDRSPCPAHSINKKRADGSKIQERLQDAAAAHGEAAGSSDTTAKRGASPALNPAFVCWLMGFPPAWDACAPTEMPSSRKSRRK